MLAPTPPALHVTTLAFDAASHRYTLDGVPVPSVTQVLKSTGYIRLDGVPPAVLERARDRGERVHKALHFLFDDDLDESSIDPEIAGYVQSARAYLETTVGEPLRAEMRVWSRRYYCAGMLDMLAFDRRAELFVADYKTGDPSDVAADLQLAAYQGFLLEMADEDADLSALLRRVRNRVGRRSIRLFGDGRPGRETVYTGGLDFSRFLGALSVVHHQAKRPAPAVAWDDER